MPDCVLIFIHVCFSVLKDEFTETNITTKLITPNLTNQTYQIRFTKPNLPPKPTKSNQTYEIDTWYDFKAVTFVKSLLILGSVVPLAMCQLLKDYRLEHCTNCQCCPLYQFMSFYNTKSCAAVRVADLGLSGQNAFIFLHFH